MEMFSAIGDVTGMFGVYPEVMGVGGGGTRVKDLGVGYPDIVVNVFV